MRLEFLPDGSEECPLVRLFDFTPEEVKHLRMAIADLAAGHVQRVAVHEFLGVEATSGCKLVLCRRTWDQAMLQVGSAAFECGFTDNTWSGIAGLIEPFEKGSRGYQWLAGAPGDASLLLSASRQW